VEAVVVLPLLLVQAAAALAALALAVMLILGLSEVLAQMVGLAELPQQETRSLVLVAAVALAVRRLARNQRAVHQ
jgi:hypothetical protein